MLTERRYKPLLALGRNASGQGFCARRSNASPVFSSPNHYRVLEFKNPTRLALDIKH